MKINEITEMQGMKPSIIKNLKPGQSAEVDHGDGTKTMIDLKKNPNFTLDVLQKMAGDLRDSEDTLVDMANYALIALILYEEDNGKKK